MAGKSLDELKLDDTHRPSDPDPRGTDWYRFSQEIEDLLATGKYTFAEETLRGIQVTVEKSKRVTDGQRRAVKNIEDSKTKYDKPFYNTTGWRRRYEGY